VLGHIEAMALEAACVVLERHGFNPTSRIYDGCLVTHNPDGSLEAAITDAEVAVAAAVGFPWLALKEKDMFALREVSLPHSTHVAAEQAVIDAINCDERI
jgi:ribonuclease PH